MDFLAFDALTPPAPLRYTFGPPTDETIPRPSFAPYHAIVHAYGRRYLILQLSSGDIAARSNFTALTPIITATLLVTRRCCSKNVLASHGCFAV